MASVNVVAHNLQGMFTNRQLGITNNNRAKSSEKLSSGYKINRAADDAAGLSISEKMRRQIRGLSQGTENAQDGVSMCQTADGALAEVGDMLHRITELSVKSANGTNSPSDRQDIQAEINEILQEIDRVSNTTKFNEIYLFKIGSGDNTESTISTESTGVIDTSISQSSLSNDEIMDQLLSKTYPNINKDVVLDDVGVTISKDRANELLRDLSDYTMISYIPRNGYSFPTDSAEIASFFWNMNDMYNSLYKKEYEQIHGDNTWESSSAYRVAYDISNPSSGASQAKQGFENGDPNAFWGNHQSTWYGGAQKEYSFFGASDAPSDIRNGYTVHMMQNLCKMISAPRNSDCINWFYYTSVNPIKTTVDSGELRDLYSNCNWQGYPASSVESTCDIYRYLFSHQSQTQNDENETNKNENNKNGIWIQSGAENSDRNGMYVEIDRMDTEVLGIKDLDASTLEGARDAIGRMEPALLKLNNIRSKIGAQQNRLEHTIKNQLNVVENTQASESLIRDADMADELVKYSKEGILQQAGQAMLSQANQAVMK